MDAVKTLIIGVIAVLVGVVLIGPVTSVVSGTTSQGSCPTGGTVRALDGSTNINEQSTDVIVPVETRGAGASTAIYPAGTICRAAATTAPASGARIASAATFWSATEGTGGQAAGSLGYGFASSRSLAILVPLIFVAGVLVIPIYMIWGRMGRGAGM